MSDNIVEHYRIVYGFIDFMGDIGGILGLMISICAFITGAFVQHDFVIKADAIRVESFEDFIPVVNAVCGNKSSEVLIQRNDRLINLKIGN